MTDAPRESAPGPRAGNDPVRTCSRQQLPAGEAAAPLSCAPGGVQGRHLGAGPGSPARGGHGLYGNQAMLAHQGGPGGHVVLQRLYNVPQRSSGLEFLLETTWCLPSRQLRQTWGSVAPASLRVGSEILQALFRR